MEESPKSAIGEQQHVDKLSVTVALITTPTIRRQEINLGRSCSVTYEQHCTISKEHNNNNT